MLFGGKNTRNPDKARSESNPGAKPIIFDANIQDFEQSVILASMQQPVIVDFWAPWCGPCKQMMPFLEKVVREAGGQVLLAKVNIDENQQLAAMMRIQSVPTVYAFFQGQPIDGFQGAQSESTIKAFVEKLITAARNAQPDALDIPESLKTATLALAENDLSKAQSIYAQILQQDPLNALAYVGMVRTLITAGMIEQAQHLVDNAPKDIASSTSFSEAKAALALATRSLDTPVAALEEKIAKNPKDHQARIDLAMALYGTNRREECIDALLESIALDREWNEQAARKELLWVFEALGHGDPLTIAGRRKLSSLLFS